MKLRQSILLAVSVLFLSIAATVATAMSDSRSNSGLNTPAIASLASAPEPIAERTSSGSERNGLLPVLAVVAAIAASPFVRKALRA
jgi:hypothetical protein